MSAGSVLPSLFMSVRMVGTSGSLAMMAYDRVPLGPFDHESFGFLSGPRPTWPCSAGTQKAYCGGIGLLAPTPPRCTLSDAAEAGAATSAAMAAKAIDDAASLIDDIPIPP